MVQDFVNKLYNYDKLNKDDQDEVYREAMYGGLLEPEETPDTDDKKYD